MRSVHFLVNRSRVVDYLMTPVRANRRRLKERGYRIQFFRRISERLLSCDILGLVSKPTLKEVDESQTVIGEDSPTVELLRRARNRAGKVVWLDSSDSTGVTHFELLPHVDLYLKKQLLKDRSLYREPMYGGRPYTDYYHREFGVEDSERFVQHYPLKEEHEPKVHLSWNIALGELYHSFSWWGRLRRLVPFLLPPRLEIPFTPPGNRRPRDFFLRASTDLHRETVAFHRKELIRRLQRLIDEHGLTGSVSRQPGEEYLPLEEYRRRIQRAKIVFGPFGWGELNLREYEALMFGALLLRTDLSHMETWPELFRDGETCVFYRWDFADLEEKVLRYLEDDEERLRIAASGQEAYRDLLSEEGMEWFCDWFVQQMER